MKWTILGLLLVVLLEINERTTAADVSSSDAVEYLYLGEIIQSVHVKPSLKTLIARRNGIQEVLIDDEDNHQLWCLEVIFNKLRSIPANINRLKNLTLLFLNHNEIDVVNTDVFVGLNNLQFLKLNKNRITRLHTTVALSLPALDKLDLGDNQIETLDISLWDFPSLELIDLSANKLHSVNGLTQKFSTLSDIFLLGNRWNCTWLQQVVRESQTNNWKIYSEAQCLE